MNMDFADAMRAAMNLTREQKLIEATRVIQRALSSREAVPSGPPSEARVERLTIENKVIDLTAEVMEPEATASAELKADTRSDRPRIGAARSRPRSTRRSCPCVACSPPRP